MAKKSQTKRVPPAVVFNYLRSKGVPTNHAIGMLTNIQAESNFDPAAIGDNGHASGLFQHNTDRQRAMIKFVGPNWRTNWKKQIDFALQDDNAPKYLKKEFSTPQAASEWFTLNYERPSNKEFKAVRRAKLVPTMMKSLSNTTATDPFSKQGLKGRLTQQTSDEDFLAAFDTSPAIPTPSSTTPTISLSPATSDEEFLSAFDEPTAPSVADTSTDPLLGVMGNIDSPEPPSHVIPELPQEASLIPQSTTPAVQSTPDDVSQNQAAALISGAAPSAQGIMGALGLDQQFKDVSDLASIQSARIGASGQNILKDLSLALGLPTDAKAVSPIQVQQQEADVDQQFKQAEANFPLTALTGELAATAAIPTGGAVKTGSRLFNLAAQGALDAAIFEATQTEEATPESVLTAAGLGGAAGGVIGGAAKLLKKASSAFSKKVVKNFLRSKDPSLADEFLNVKEFRFAKSKDDLLEKAGTIIKTQESKLDKILSKSKSKVNLAELIQKELAKPNSKLSQIVQNDIAVGKLNTIEGKLKKIMSANSKPLNMLDANARKRSFYKQAKVKDNGQPTNDLLFEIGILLKNNIEELVPTAPVQKINAKLGTAIGVEKALSKELTGFSAATDIARLLGQTGFAGLAGLLGGGVGTAGTLAAGTAAAGAAAKTAPGISAITAGARGAQKLPEASKIINMLLPQLGTGNK